MSFEPYQLTITINSISTKFYETKHNHRIDIANFPCNFREFYPIHGSHTSPIKKHKFNKWRSSLSDSIMFRQDRLNLARLCYLNCTHLEVVLNSKTRPRSGKLQRKAGKLHSKRLNTCACIFLSRNNFGDEKTVFRKDCSNFHMKKCFVTYNIMYFRSQAIYTLATALIAIFHIIKYYFTHA